VRRARPADEGPALAVYVAWHPESEHAATLAGAMFKTLCADPEIPASRGLGVPVWFRTWINPSSTPLPVPFDAAEHTAVFVLADDHLVSASSWRSYVEDLAGAPRAADRVIPVAMTNTSNLPPRLGALQGIRLSHKAEADHELALLNGALHDLCRLLDPGAAKVTVFLSHAKQDGLDITTSIRRYLREDAGLNEFFDASYIPDGAKFAEVITEAAGSLPALLAVQTDTYASRQWCRLEVLEAKRRYVPIVILAAVQRSETRSFPYAENAVKPLRSQKRIVTSRR
jgi:TIR domain